MAIPGVPQTAFQAITNVKWASKTFLVVTTKRDKNEHGHGSPSCPRLFIKGIENWDAAYNDFHINTNGMRRNFPKSTLPPPLVKDLAGTLRWGGNPVPDRSGGGTVGAAKAPVQPVVYYPQEFGETGYTDGLVVRDLLVFNIGPIKAITGLDDFTVQFITAALPKIDEPPPAGDTTVYYLWGTPSGFGSQMPPLVGTPVFTGTTGDPPPYYSALFAVADIGTPSEIRVPYYQAIHWRLSTYPLTPGDPPIPIAYPNAFTSIADVQSVINWAAAVGFLGSGTGFRWNSLVASTGIVPGSSVPPITQPEQHYEIKFALFTATPEPLPDDPNLPVPFFPITSQNVPLFDFEKAKTVLTRTIGGSAPQTARTYNVKITANKELTVTPA